MLEGAVAMVSAEGDETVQREAGGPLRDAVKAGGTNLLHLREDCLIGSNYFSVGEFIASS